jgi:flagellar biosynthesis protein FliR
MGSISTADLYLWVSGLLWPLTRIMGLISTAPLFGHRSIPVRVKMGLGVLLASIISPTLPQFPLQDPLSWIGLLILTQQLLIGLAMGLTLRIVWSGIEMAGEIIGMTMGLGFATFFDPTSQGRSSAISQFLTLLLLMLMLASDLHLLLIEVLAESFTTIPITVDSFNRDALRDLSYWGTHLFSLGIQISMPIITALLIINMALGVLTRAAPQLNLFGIGFPITLSIGFLMMAITVPYWASPMGNAVREGIQLVRELTQMLNSN